MGLDMYLMKKTFIWSNYDDGKKKRELSNVSINNQKYSHIKPERINYVIEEVWYWRKANQIHRWFVENVQGGKDDCGEYAVSEEQLNELLYICKQIKEKCPLVDGKIRNGQHAGQETGGKFVDNIEDGKLMKNSHIAAKLLPSKPGFFFGSTDYDQYYMCDIDNTIDIIESVLSEKESGKDYLPADIYYSSSW